MDVAQISAIFGGFVSLITLGVAPFYLKYMNTKAEIKRTTKQDTDDSQTKRIAELELKVKELESTVEQQAKTIEVLYLQLGRNALSIQKLKEESHHTSEDY